MGSYDEESVARRWLAGESAREIADAHGISYETVRNVAKRRGLYTEEMLEKRRRLQEEIRRKRKYETRICPGCGGEFQARKSTSKKYHSPGCAGRARAIGRDELVAEMRRVAEEVGGTPTTEDLNSLSDYSAMTWIREYGSLTDGQKAAGLKPNRSGGRGGRRPLPKGWTA